jgi:hypothetical protein
MIEPLAVQIRLVIVLPLKAVLVALKVTLGGLPEGTVRFRVCPLIADWLPEVIVKPAVGGLDVN